MMVYIYIALYIVINTNTVLFDGVSVASAIHHVCPSLLIIILLLIASPLVLLSSSFPPPTPPSLLRLPVSFFTISQ